MGLSSIRGRRRSLPATAVEKDVTDHAVVKRAAAGTPRTGSIKEDDSLLWASEDEARRVAKGALDGPLPSCET